MRSIRPVCVRVLAPYLSVGDLDAQKSGHIFFLLQIEGFLEYGKLPVDDRMAGCHEDAVIDVYHY
jgi:hypothetical protein